MSQLRKRNLFLLSLFLGVFFVGILFTSTAVLAQTSPDLGLQQVSDTGLSNMDIRTVVANIIRIFLGLLGVIAVVLMIYAGFIWMTAGGNEEKIGESKKILVNATIGLVIILSAYAIVSFVITRLLSATSNYPQHCYDGILNEDESDKDCGGSCQPCGNGGGVCTDPPCGFTNVFFVEKLPSAGSVCIRNVKLAVVFSEAIDVNTLNENTVAIKKQSDNSVVSGNWQLGNDRNIALFVPSGSCSPIDGGNDCLAANTSYVLDINNSRQGEIKNASGGRSLNCGLKAKCEPVVFTTGDGVDRNPPVVSLEIIPPFQSGLTIPAKINFTDDNGLQNAAFYAGGYFVGSQSLANCQKNGTVTIDWSTAGMLGNYSTKGVGLDWAGQSAEANQTVKLLPQHCFNRQQDVVENETGVDCGVNSGCGNCGGDKCSDGAQCASGYCEIVAPATEGVCVDKMKISDVSPLDGASGTFVSIVGNYFGTKVGKVYFSKIANPNKNILNDWQEASLANCSADSKTWTPWQVVVEVPADSVVSGPIMVETASSTGADKIERKFFDTTNDTWGRKISDFRITNQVRPGLCPIVPDNGKPNDPVVLRGKNFGGDGQVFFGSVQAPKISWADTLIGAKVPYLDKGSLGVYVKPNGRLESNSVYYYISGTVGKDDPTISEISPNVGAKGEYITISGSKFGDTQGRVWFQKNSESVLNGDNSFPADCAGAVWSDTQIITKFPASESLGDYSVWISTGDSVSRVSAPAGQKFKLESGVPAPGICKIDPVSGPVPFAEKGTMKIYGEYFTFTSGTANYGSRLYFWKSGASKDSLDSRAEVNSFRVNQNNYLEIATPPNGTVTGPVVANRNDSKKFGNGVNFTVSDCVKNNGCTTSGTHCCVSGDDKGVCRPDNELCAGEVRSTGYIWRFSTRDIPVPLTVIEKCDDATEAGKALPSPSPSTIWNRTGFPNDFHSNVCRNALIEIEFSRGDTLPTPADAVLVGECQEDSLDLENRFCKIKTGGDVVIKDQNGKNNNFEPQPSLQTGESAGRDYLELSPDVAYNNGKWKDGTWYRVVLKNAISAGSGTSTINLSSTKPCDVNEDGKIDSKDGSAYCFFFKTGATDCALSKVVITPYSYWTSYLEVPLREHSVGGDVYDLFYSGHGLSSQRCVMMDVSGFNWQWTAVDKRYADIYSNSTSVRNVQISSLQNTVGVDLFDPENARNISARASSGAKSYVGNSPLTIDLSNPKVKDYWPNCLEVCTDAAIGARFNLTMSEHNLNSAVKLYRCNDENCLSLTEVDLQSVSFNEATAYTELDIKPSAPLEKEIIYQVVLSNNHTPVSNMPSTNRDDLWSVSRYSDRASYSKPLEQFVWRFRTKKEACKIDRVEVLPKVFYAPSLTAKTIYRAQPYSAPDACSASGQKLSTANVNWAWESGDEKVAVTTEFTSVGYNPYCTADCIRKGSDVPVSAVAENLRVCGNGKVEAGEDCDEPNAAQGCGLNCLRMGNDNATTTASSVSLGLCGDGFVTPERGEECDPNSSVTSTRINCGKNCLNLGSKPATGAQDVSASVCGNGYKGAGEDCDLGITASSANPSSSMGCSANCLHQGTRLSTKWCGDHVVDMGGFTTSSYRSYCIQAYSQCGDGVQNPDEDPGCDLGGGKFANTCNEYCLLKQGDHTSSAVDPNNDAVGNNNCAVAGTEGCGNNNQHVGSSLLYSNPSICGDGVVGLGEDGWCEHRNSLVITKTDGFVNPWVLVTGVGRGVPGGIPLAQRAEIKAKTNTNTSGGTVKEGKGEFVIKCGFQSDAECQLANKGDLRYGVAANSCCFLRPQLTELYPGVIQSNPIGPTADEAKNVCPNTYISANFDQVIDSRTLSGNFIIARGTDSNSCNIAAGEENVTELIKKIAAVGEPTKWYASVLQKIVYFFKNLIGSDVQAVASVNVKTWCAGQDVGTAEVIADTYGGGSKIKVDLKKLLAFNTDYAIILSPEIKDVRGVKIGEFGKSGKSIFWRFSTGAEVCSISQVTVYPDQYYFSTAGATTTLEAYALTENRRLIQSIPGAYAWDMLWGPQNNNFVSLTNTASALNVITAKNQNGEIDIRASVNITDNKYGAAGGLVATGRSHIIVFLCENPWPPKDLVVDKIIFPYEDKIGNNDEYSITDNIFTGKPIINSPVGVGYFNFATYYCADNGSTGKYDDLPYLRPAVQVADSLVSATSTLKRFIFTSEKNSDAIGIQIFPNTEHLTARQWFMNSKDFGGQGFTGNLQSLKIDGYDAVSDGNNIYVDAVDISSAQPNPTIGKLWTNIYLFSINADAKPETRNVYDQIIKNLNFNTNLTNYGYCGATVSNPGSTTTCATNFDCPMNEVCSVQSDSLKRDYQRLRDLKSIEKTLDSYYTKNGSYPDLKEGTYLSGQTLSTWPSWSVLSNAVGNSLPVDPINRLAVSGSCSSSTGQYCLSDDNCPKEESCILHDATTGWSTADRRFSFSCNDNSFAYRYIFSTSTGFKIYNRFEDLGVEVTNLNDFLTDFISSPDRFSVFDPIERGICLPGESITTMQAGYCGDGKLNLNLGEKCDPPGYKEYETGCTGDGDTKKVNTCNANCSGWTGSTVPCESFSKCGNNITEIGEVCDEGSMNGRYNHCSADCKSLHSALGWCGDNIVTTTYEVCDPSVRVLECRLDNKVCDGGPLKGNDCNSNRDCALLCKILPIGRGVATYYPATLGSNGFVCDKGGALEINTSKCEADRCDIVQNGLKYGMTKTESCNYDCQNYGPYCGDGIVQSEFGEECDGDQSCSKDGVAGVKKCSTSCRFAEREEGVWFRFDSVGKEFNDNRIFDNVSVDPLTGGMVSLCYADAQACPSMVPGKFGQALNFDGINDYLMFPFADVDIAKLTVPKFSVSAWVYPINNEYGTIVEKGGVAVNNGFSFGYGGGKAQFSIYDGSLPYRQAGGAVSLNQWSHVVGVFDGSVAKIYINGQFVSSTDTIIKSDSSVGFDVGKTTIGIAKNYFKGKIDELSYFTRVLTDAEIKDLYDTNWMCSTAVETTATELSTKKVCGDGIIGDGEENGSKLNEAGVQEVCDNIGQNGVACVPGYNKSCSYCSADCSAVIFREAVGYCGDGIINGTEVCDVDSKTNTMYAAASSNGTSAVKESNVINGYKVKSCSEEANTKINASSTYWSTLSDWANYLLTFKKGTKSCIDDCQTIQNNCVECGLSAGGSEIKGALINVLEPNNEFVSSKYLTPLYYDETGWDMDNVLLYFTSNIEKADFIRERVASQEEVRPANFNKFTLFPANSSGTTGTSTLAKINTNPVCSITTVDNGAHYQMVFNGDRQTKHTIDLDVVSNPAPWQYDQVLSPIIRLSNYPSGTSVGKDNTTILARPKDIRIVVRWVDDKDVIGGFVTPPTTPTLEGASFKYKSVGVNYYASTTADYMMRSIWYHGLVWASSKTTVESFTVDTSSTLGTYAFYVRTPGEYNFKAYSGSKLQVEVYVPEDEVVIDGSDDSWRHFSRPAKVFYLSDAIQSDNPQASYWHVFNIKKTPSTDSFASLKNIEATFTKDGSEIPISRILTSEAYLQFSY